MQSIEQTKKSLTIQAVVSASLSLVVILSLNYSLGGQAPAGAPAPSAPGLLWPGLLVVAATWFAMLRRALGLLAARPPAKPVPPPPPKEEKKPVTPPQQTAVQILAALQRQGRLIDFLQEDLGTYEDAQIGAAVRSVHSGCKEALAEAVRLEPVLRDEEGAEISVPAGFDPKAIRLTGIVKGSPPFRGVLRHKGWRDLQAGVVLAPAEVEVHG